MGRFPGNWAWPPSFCPSHNDLSTEPLEDLEPQKTRPMIQHRVGTEFNT